MNINPLHIHDQNIEQINKYKYLGVTIDDQLKWNFHIDTVESKLNKRLYFVKKLQEFNIDKTICTLFYRSVLESVITFGITAWGGNALKNDTKRIDRLINKASKCTHAVSNVSDLFSIFCLSKFKNILKDDKHPLFKRILFSCRTGRPLSLRTKTERHLNSFLPFAVRHYNDKLRIG